MTLTELEIGRSAYPIEIDAFSVPSPNSFSPIFIAPMNTNSKGYNSVSKDLKWVSFKNKFCIYIHKEYSTFDTLCYAVLDSKVSSETLYTVELQWLEHLWDHEN